MLNYSIFYKKFGVRRKEQLLSPLYVPYSTLQLPLKSYLHYLPSSDATVGPSITDPLVNGDWRYVWVSHLQELKSFEGSPRFVGVNYLGRIRDYQHSQPRLMWLRKDPTSVIDPKSLVVLAYGGLAANYVYKRDVISTLYKWRNVYTTIFKEVNNLVVGGRQQFLTIEVPAHIPTRANFELAENELTLRQLKVFQTPELKMLLDLYTWLGANRTKSVLATLMPQGLADLNIILKINDRSVIINLGVLNSFRQDVESVEGDMAGFSPAQIQKVFLKMLLDLVVPDRDIPVVMDGLARQELRSIIKSRFDDDTEVVETEDDIPEPDVAPIDFSDVDAALALHDDIQSDTTDIVDDIVLNTDAEPAPVIVPYVPPKDSLTDTINQRARTAVAEGTITLAELQRFRTLAETYTTIPNPFGEGTLKDVIVIKPEELVITEHTPIVDIPTVLDKTMLKSTLIDFDSRYIENILHKDILAFTLGIQKAGIAVTGLKIDEVEDVMNHFHRYTINVTPVAGKASTFVMEIPVVDADGIILAGGVKYYLKKQHGEMPIRKTSPTRVSLTSYFGKVFVDRSENVVHNYGLWLSNQIRTLGLDATDGRITELRLSSNFNHRVVLPRLYTLLSKSFGSLIINTTLQTKPVALQLYFDYDNRTTIFDATVMNALEADGTVLVGRYANSAIVMNANGELYLKTVGDNTKVMALPTIEAMLDLPVEKAPLEVATINLFGKTIPLGFALAYRLGLPTLLATLGVSYRKVAAGRTMAMTTNEFRIKFKDESWIFSKSDKVAALLINGFNILHRSVASYPSAAFAKKDVYANIIEDAGLTVYYIRELDMMFDMFIDHITKSLLEEMGEPTDMFNLLVRATQLLLVDYYPDEGDKRFMRTKGYERVAGAVYSELVKAIRKKLNNPSIVKSSLEVNPMAVKLNVLMDSAKEIVEEINPIHNLKMGETVTFGGTGGRSVKTMVKSTRAYHATDMGLMSEATVDSGQVGIIAYLTADPNFTSLRGTTRRYDPKDGLSSLVSTSMLLSPCAEND